MSESGSVTRSRAMARPSSSLPFAIRVRASSIFAGFQYGALATAVAAACSATAKLSARSAALP